MSVREGTPVAPSQGSNGPESAHPRSRSAGAGHFGRNPAQCSQRPRRTQALSGHRSSGQGPGVRLLAADSPLSEAITQVQDLGVEIFACGNSMRSIGLDAEVLTVGIGTVSAAVAHLAERQWEGWAYVRP